MKLYLLSTYSEARRYMTIKREERGGSTFSKFLPAGLCGLWKRRISRDSLTSLSTDSWLLVEKVISTTRKNHTNDKSVLSLRHQPHSLWQRAQSMLSLRREPSFVPPWRVRRRCAAWWPWPPEWKRKWFSFVWNRREEGQHVKPACNGVAQFDQPALVYRERAKSVKFLRHPKGWKHITNC